jgi:nitroreductase
MKKIIKSIIPTSLFNYMRRIRTQVLLIKAYVFDYKRYSKYSATKKYDTQLKLRALIIKDYHIVEKGLTMPETRFGFGKEKLLELIKLCQRYYTQFPPDAQVNHGISVIFEYKEFHEKQNYQLDADVLKAIAELDDLGVQHNIQPTEQVTVTREQYFNALNSPFKEFSASRKSIRNYSTEEIDESIIQSVLNLAANAPSACNRQTSKAYVFTGKEKIEKVLGTQNGNRGFGFLANKVFVVSAELGVFAKPMERNQAFIDGGIYTMNLLYSLHAHGIAACVLNCSTDPNNDRLQHQVTGIPESEVIIAMVSCGYPVPEFKIPLSKRTYHNCTINR